MQTAELITLAIAVYGAVLSTVLAVREFRKDKRQVRLFCMEKDSWLIDDVSIKGFEVRAVNIGHRPVELIEAGLITNRGEYVNDISMTSSIHATLNDGESASVFFSQGSMMEALQKIAKTSPRHFKRMFVRAADGRVYHERLPKKLQALYLIGRSQ